MTIKAIGVFCGSSMGFDDVYQQQAYALGQQLALQSITLVYGGATVGLMGVIADAALEHGGDVIGVIPQSLREKEIAHQGLTQLHVVQTMHERKALMADLSDAVVMMPGGAGSLDEFFEMLTWAQLNYHQKPCAIYNVNHYYDQLLSFLEHVQTEGFIHAAHREMIVVESESGKLIDAVRGYVPSQSTKWVHKSERCIELVETA